MKRSAINFLLRAAAQCFHEHHWFLPPCPRWDVTDFGLGNWQGFGLVLLNLAEEPEYCEKLMYARHGMITPAHCHHKKKEDIICRWGRLAVQIWADKPAGSEGRKLAVPVNGEPVPIISGGTIVLEAGSRVTLVPRIYHAFWPLSVECIIGEVSTANDDREDNDFVDPAVGRYPGIEEDEAALFPLISEEF